MKVYYVINCDVPYSTSIVRCQEQRPESRSSVNILIQLQSALFRRVKSESEIVDAVSRGRAICPFGLNQHQPGFRIARVPGPVLCPSALANHVRGRNVSGSCLGFGVRGRNSSSTKIKRLVPSLYGLLLSKNTYQSPKCHRRQKRKSCHRTVRARMRKNTSIRLMTMLNKVKPKAGWGHTWYVHKAAMHSIA